MTRRRDDEKGIALLVTLLILVLVVALAHEVFRIGAQSAQTGAYGRDSIRCLLLAEGGTGAARIALRVDARDNQYDTLDEVWSRAALPITLGDGEVRVTIEDEERKIDLNRLMLPNGNAPDERRLAVFQRPWRTPSWTGWTTTIIPASAGGKVPTTSAFRTRTGRRTTCSTRSGSCAWCVG
jgi:type II secretory pathway component PulK